MAVPTTFEQVWSEAVRALAFVRVVEPAEVLAEAASGGGDVVIKSKDAEVVISVVEQALGGEVLATASSLGREQLTSLRNLSSLLWNTWRQAHGKAA